MTASVTSQTPAVSSRSTRRVYGQGPSITILQRPGLVFGAQYFAGYIVEKTLSIDNLFVFVIIMSAFAVPPQHQQKLLILGIALALVMRAIFIAMGAALLAYFSFMFLLFGVLLIYTGFALYKHRDEDPDVGDNVLVVATKKLLPTTDEYVGGKLFTRIKGKLTATPMFIGLIAIGTTDLLFALDSIPAVFGVTSEPYIVFVANAFALLGLRALFFLVKGLLDRLVHLSIGLAIILVFIGVKLVLHWAHGIWPAVPEVSTGFSLAVILVVITITTITSVLAVVVATSELRLGDQPDHYVDHGRDSDKNPQELQQPLRCGAR